MTILDMAISIILQYSTWAISINNMKKMPLKKEIEFLLIPNPFMKKISKFSILFIVWKCLGYASAWQSRVECEIFLKKLRYYKEWLWKSNFRWNLFIKYEFSNHIRLVISNTYEIRRKDSKDRSKYVSFLE